MGYVVPAGMSEPVDENGKPVHIPHIKLTSKTVIEKRQENRPRRRPASGQDAPPPPLDEGFTGA